MAYSVFVQIWLPDTVDAKKVVRSMDFGQFVQATLEASIEGYLRSALGTEALWDGKVPTVSCSRIIEQV